MIIKHHGRGHFWCNTNIEIHLSNKIKSNNWNNDCFTSLEFNFRRSISKMWESNRSYISEWQAFNRSSS